MAIKHTVVLTATFPAVARELLAGELEVVEHPTEHGRSEEEMIAILGDADGAITLLSDPITRTVLRELPHLRIVANFAVGYDNIDIEAARELGVRVTNTPGVLIGSATEEARNAMARIAATEVLRFFRGLPAIHGVV
jgi:glyoxylate reductase